MDLFESNPKLRGLWGAGSILGMEVVKIRTMVFCRTKIRFPISSEVN